MAAYAVLVEGIDTEELPSNISKGIERAAYRAINKTADKTRADSARRILEQVAFPATYLAPSGGRLKVVHTAGPGDLEARIRGQFRPTSLSRFVVGSPKRGNGVTVNVGGGARFMRRAFLIKLTGNAENKFNMGLAIRLKPGEEIRNKKIARRLSRGLYLLYGPSVDQVFRTVAVDVGPGAALTLEKEFLRLLELDDGK